MIESVLVVGEESALRETLVRLIGLEGYEVGGAPTVEETLARLETEMLTIVFMDLSLSEGKGEEIARILRERWPTLGLVLVAEQSEAEQAAALLADGADDCLLKSRCRTDLAVVLKRVVGIAALRRENRELKKNLSADANDAAKKAGAKLRDLSRTRRLTMRSLVIALGSRETETRRHCKRVADYTLQMAEQLGLGNRERNALFRGALLHDMGKIGIPDGILLKPGPLTEAEWAVMHSHPRLGHNILRDLTFLNHAAECALFHHERWDGAGYPLGLSEADIPKAARIVAVADAIDAMSVQRPFRGPLSFDRIIEELVNNRGTQFDPEVVDVALKLYHSWDDLHVEAQRRRHTTHDPGGRRGRFSMSAREDGWKAA
jgi:putative nucleotidyltransferase with HDIG domain